MKAQFLRFHSLKLGISAGIIGAISTFLTTIFGIYNLSKVASFMSQTVWGSLGYSVSWTGAILGIIIGFIYAFVPVWLGALIYNKLLSK